MFCGRRLHCPQTLVKRTLGRFNTGRGPLLLGGHALGKIGVADVKTADIARYSRHRLNDRHQIRAHLYGVHVVIAKNRMLDDGQKAQLARQTLRHVLDCVYTADGMHGAAMVLWRQLCGTNHSQCAGPQQAAT